MVLIKWTIKEASTSIMAYYLKPGFTEGVCNSSNQCIYGSATATTVDMYMYIRSWIPLTVSSPPAEMRILVTILHTLAPAMYIGSFVGK